MLRTFRRLSRWALSALRVCLALPVPPVRQAYPEPPAPPESAVQLAQQVCQEVQALREYQARLALRACLAPPDQQESLEPLVLLAFPALQVRLGRPVFLEQQVRLESAEQLDQLESRVLLDLLVSQARRVQQA